MRAQPNKKSFRMSKKGHNILSQENTEIIVPNEEINFKTGLMNFSRGKRKEEIRPENPSGEMRGGVYSHIYFQSNTTSVKDVVRYYWSILAYCRALGKTHHSLCHPKENFKRTAFVICS